MQYKTVKGFGTAEITEKHSRFIGACMPVSTLQQASEFVAAVKSENKEASHNCSAYLLRDGGLSHSSDDGEPSGTAGKPILELLTRGEIFDAVIVVTRYFGGTLLGTGGLVRAYSGAASLAVENAGIAVMRRCASYDISLDYSDYKPLQTILDSLGAQIEDTVFAADVRVRAVIPDELSDELCERITHLTRGRCVPIRTGSDFRPF